MKLKTSLLFAVIIFVVLASAFFMFSSRHRDKTMGAILSPASWQHMVTPGELSKGHAFLDSNCAACHTPVKGVEAKNCIVCHADNLAVLQRQPSAFHADIGECSSCHLEHQGRVASTTKMDHVALARIGIKQLERAPQRGGADAAQIKRWLDEVANSPQPGTSQPAITGVTAQFAHSHLQPEEALLNCASCHSTKDRHRGLFGKDCAQCHATAKWTLPDFRHPSAASQSCSQCHQAPPSHYMMHFEMISAKVAGKPHAKVNECYACHQTTSWNDIKGVGFYKHH
jgi:hypothetical protein